MWFQSMQRSWKSPKHVLTSHALACMVKLMNEPVTVMKQVLIVSSDVISQDHPKELNVSQLEIFHNCMVHHDSL